jgi:hypothetical protein
LSPEDYFNQINENINKKEFWRLAKEMAVGFFSFSKLRLYRDLDDASWPIEKQLTDHLIIQDILAGGKHEGVDAQLFYREEYDIDNDPDSDKIPLVLDADSSQHSTIVDAILKGKNLVIEGSPGTYLVFPVFYSGEKFNPNG